MKRSRSDHLTEIEVADLHRRILAGEKTARLAREFNIAERTVCIHRAKIRGTFKGYHNKEVAVAPTDTSHVAVARICWVEECGVEISDGKFCERHQFKHPDVSPLILKKMSARAA